MTMFLDRSLAESPSHAQPCLADQAQSARSGRRVDLRETCVALQLQSTDRMIMSKLFLRHFTWLQQVISAKVLSGRAGVNMQGSSAEN